MDRLDKILVSQNVGSRKEVQKLIKDGAVCVNGECIKQPQHKVDAVADDITVGGQPLLYSKYVYIMMNKPAGVLSASNDKRAETVIDLLPEDSRQADWTRIPRDFLLLQMTGNLRTICFHRKNMSRKST